MALKSFPRGGKKPEIKKHSNVLFDEKGKIKKKHKTQIKKKKADNLVTQDTNIITDTAERLSNTTLLEGMVILCRISDVAEYNLTVSIPGGYLGRVDIADISESYSNQLQEIVENGKIPNELKLLSDLYKPGDYVVCCLKKINVEGFWLYSLSLKPQLVNQNLHSSYLTKDTKIICTIKSIEDHGYVIDTGIINVRAFLATENVDKGKQYFLGNQLMCAIKKTRLVDHSPIFELSTKKKSVNNVNMPDTMSIDFLTPGIRLSLCVTKVLSNGLQVTFGKDNIGYINRMYLDKPLSAYVDNMVVTGTLLYVLPTMKFAYFSLLTDISEKEKMRAGDIIKKAEVLYRESNGIVFKLSESGIHGFVSFQRTDVPFAKIKSTFRKHSTHKCRIIAYNWMEHIYVCTMEHKILEGEYILVSDIKCGDILTVTVVDINTERGTIYVQAGKKIRGLIPRLHISDNGPSVLTKLKIGDSMKARVLQLHRVHVRFTLKESLMKSKLPVLYDICDAKRGSKYHCTITKMEDNGMLVRFYGQLTAWIPHRKLDDTNDMNWNYTVGQTIVVCIYSLDKNKRSMKLKIVTEGQKEQSINLTIGEMVEGRITESSTKGVHLRIQKNEDFMTGFLPAGHMAPCIEIGTLLASKSVPGDTISAFVFATQPTVILSRTFITQEQYRSFDLLKVGDCIPCTIRDISQDGVRVVLPINNYSKFGFVSYKNVSNPSLLLENQMLFVKIKAIHKREKELTLTMSLRDVWESMSEHEIKMMTAVDILNLYLSKLLELANNTFYENRPILSAVLGQKVIGTVQNITKYGLVLQLDNNLIGTVRKEHYSGELQVGDKVSGTILWKNYVHEVVEVSLLPRIINNISSKQNLLQELPTGVTLKGEILIITKWLILVLIKRNGSGYLAALPVRRHANDISPDLTPYVIHAKIRIYVIMTREESNIIPICMLKSAFETPRVMVETEPTSATNKKKRKVSEQHDVGVTDLPKKKRKVESNRSEIAMKKKKEDEEESKINDNPESNNDNSDSEIEIEEDKSIAEGLHVPECGFSWDDKESLAVAVNTSSSDDEEKPEEESKRKKKKPSAAVRREQERQKEREIRQREEALASNQIPSSIDQFDRLVLSSPDSSLVWLQYMAYHLQATEIDKARSVAKRAIKTINFREENERLNVWNAWLNLESTFGTAESLNDVFQEALKNNDAFKIYLHMLTLLADAGKTSELEKLIRSMIDKFKKNPQTWVECGTALLKVGMKNKSRNIMQRALQYLPASQHINLLVRFANLENKHGDKERALTLFESILGSYPKRVDVWSCYVDCIIKSGNIDFARTVLKRGCSQTLPARKMKTLFTKFINFEEKYGTPETVAEARKMAADYVEKQCNEEQE